jgi:hypothetical protein
MRRFKMRWMALVGLGAMALAGGGLQAAGSAAGAATHPADLTSSAPVTVVAQGLNNPRSLVWGPHGHLLVSEAGTGGTECSGTTCFGLTASISDISTGAPVRIVSGLASFSDAGQITGPDGLVYAEGRLSTLVAQSSFAIPAGLSVGLTEALYGQLGALLDVTNPAKISVIANPGVADYVWSGVHQNLALDFPDADPFDLIAGPHDGFYLVDGASNTLDFVDHDGVVKVLAFIPRTPGGDGDAVPTCVARGPHGALYISQLTSAGNTATAANVYKYVPSTGSLTVWQSGFSAVTGCGFGANGDFYVTEFDTAGFPPKGLPVGAVIQISPNGTRTVLGAGALIAPSGFLAGPDGSIYVSNHSTFTGTGPLTGQVVKIG